MIDKLNYIIIVTNNKCYKEILKIKKEYNNNNIKLIIDNIINSILSNLELTVVKLKIIFSIYIIYTFSHLKRLFL